MMSGDSQGLSYLSWDEVDEDVAEGLSDFTIVYRRVQKDRSVEYTLMSPDNRSLKVTLEDVGEEGGDPLSGIHACRMALDQGETKVRALCLNGTTFVRR